MVEPAILSSTGPEACARAGSTWTWLVVQADIALMKLSGVAAMPTVTGAESSEPPARSVSETMIVLLSLVCVFVPLCVSSTTRRKSLGRCATVVRNGVPEGPQTAPTFALLVVVGDTTSQLGRLDKTLGYTTSFESYSKFLA